jgi:replication-associated recombination protein RarA
MIPNTLHGLAAMEVLSAMQKCIRRSMEVEAMTFACELLHTSRAFHTMTCNRLEVIAHEDLDTLAAPWIIPLVATACEQARRMYDAQKIGRSRLFVGSAILAMCRSPKSRINDHFGIAIGLANELGVTVPVVPDWTKDGHTAEGRRKGRGVAYFREHSAKLIPPPTAPDQYESEAYEMLALKQTKVKGDLFD